VARRAHDNGGRITLDVSASSGWGDEYLAGAAQFEALDQHIIEEAAAEREPAD
jgi:hypothetical protein